MNPLGESPTILPSKLPQHQFSTTEPCFNWRECHNYSVCVREGKSLCRACADAMKNRLEYPLKGPWYRMPTPTDIIFHTIGMGRF